MRYLLITILLPSCGLQKETCFTREQMVVKCVEREIRKNPEPFLLDDQKDWCARQFYWEACYKEEALERL